MSADIVPIILVEMTQAAKYPCLGVDRAIKNGYISSPKNN